MAEINFFDSPINDNMMAYTPEYPYASSVNYKLNYSVEGLYKTNYKLYFKTICPVHAQINNITYELYMDMSMCVNCIKTTLDEKIQLMEQQRNADIEQITINNTNKNNEDTMKWIKNNDNCLIADIDVLHKINMNIDNVDLSTVSEKMQINMSPNKMYNMFGEIIDNDLTIEKMLTQHCSRADITNKYEIINATNINNYIVIFKKINETNPHTGMYIIEDAIRHLLTDNNTRTNTTDINSIIDISTDITTNTTDIADTTDITTNTTADITTNTMTDITTNTTDITTNTTDITADIADTANTINMDSNIYVNLTDDERDALINIILKNESMGKSCDIHIAKFKTTTKCHICSEKLGVYTIYNYKNVIIWDSNYKHYISKHHEIPITKQFKSFQYSL